MPEKRGDRSGNEDVRGVTTLNDAIAGLRHIRTAYGAAFRVRRWRLLQAASRCAIADVKQLVVYHELLLFITAFPDSDDMLRLARAELGRIAGAARERCKRGRIRDRKALDDSGIAGTVTSVRLSLEATHWLAERYPDDTEIHWEAGSAGDGLDDMLATIIEPVEMDGVSDVALTTQEWFRLARGELGKRATSDLNWLLQHFHRPQLPVRVRGRLFDLFDVRVRWHLRKRMASRTLARLPRGAISFQVKPLRRAGVAGAAIDRPLMPPVPIVKAQARRLIDLARTVLAVRHRETDPVTFADLNDINLFDMGDGISIVLFGQRVEHRLPLDTYYGFLLFKNRVPIAYGGGWMFFDRCEIGINVFDTFRGGESSHTFA